MGEYSGSRAELPKNIRQVGERDQVVKLYIEDYVNTYLKRLYPAGGQDLRVGLLLGEIRRKRRELLESLSLYYRAMVLHENVADFLDEDEEGEVDE